MAMDPSGSAMAQFDQATAVTGYAGGAGVPGGPGMLPPQQQQQGGAGVGGGMDSPSILPPNFDVQVSEHFNCIISCLLACFMLIRDYIYIGGVLVYWNIIPESSECGLLCVPHYIVVTRVLNYFETYYWSSQLYFYIHCHSP
jgi:hypothetical protein